MVQGLGYFIDALSVAHQNKFRAEAVCENWIAENCEVLFHMQRAFIQFLGM